MLKIQRCFFAAFIFISSLFFAPAVFGQEKNAEEVKTRVIKAIVFKNGTALIRQEFKGVSDKEGWIRVSNIAPPILGTFNVISTTADQIILENLETSEAITDLTELLEANVGKTILVPEIDKDGRKNYRAEKNVSIIKQEKKESSQYQEYNYYTYYYRQPQPVKPDKLLVLQSALGTHVVSINDFTEFIAQTGQELVTTKKINKTRLAVHLLHSKWSEETIVIEYLTRGLRWIPVYRISVLDGETVEVALAAEVINDIINLENTEVEFAGGFPHFLFDELLSPISLTPFWPAFSQFITPPANGPDVYAGYAGNWQVFSGNESLTAFPISPTALQFLPGISSAETGDLHFYSLPKVTLLKDKRGKFAIWQINAPYEHLYTLTLDITKQKQKEKDDERRNSSPDYSGQGISDEMLADKSNRIWHTLNIKNNGIVPWTMGPAIAFENDRPLGQDILYFTASGTDTNFYIAPAPQIVYEYDEEIIGREKNAHLCRGYTYDLVKEKGILKIANNKSEPAKVKLVFHRGGEITEVDNKNLSVTKTAYEPDDWDSSLYCACNCHSIVSGTIELKPGEEKTIVFSRQYYNRH